MNKKGEGLGPESIIPLAFAVIVAIAVIGFITIKWAKGTEIPFLKNLQDFAFWEKKPSEIMKLRYVIDSDKVQYYDGTKWWDFTEKEYPISKKKAYAAQIGDDFESAYFNPYREYGDESEDKLIKYQDKRLFLAQIITRTDTFSSQTFNNYVSLNEGEYIFSKEGGLYERTYAGKMDIGGEMNPYRELL